MKQELPRRFCVAVLLLLVGNLCALDGEDAVIIAPASPVPVKLAAGRQTLIRSRTQVGRTAVVDPTICDVNQFTTTEFAIVARSPGTTEVTVWFADAALRPVTYLVEVNGSQR